MSQLIEFFAGKTIGGVLGSVIPSVIAFAAYICNFYIKLKQKGWRSLNEQDWRELILQIEKEFQLISSVIHQQKEHHSCEHCQKIQERLIQKAQNVNDQVNKSKSNLLTRANTKVAENLTPRPK